MLIVHKIPIFLLICNTSHYIKTATGFMIDRQAKIGDNYGFLQIQSCKELKKRYNLKYHIDESEKDYCLDRLREEKNYGDNYCLYKITINSDQIFDFKKINFNFKGCLKFGDWDYVIKCYFGIDFLPNSFFNDARVSFLSHNPSEKKIENFDLLVKTQKGFLVVLIMDGKGSFNTVVKKNDTDKQEYIYSDKIEGTVINLVSMQSDGEIRLFKCRLNYASFFSNNLLINTIVLYSIIAFVLLLILVFLSCIFIVIRNRAKKNQDKENDLSK